MRKLLAGGLVGALAVVLGFGAASLLPGSSRGSGPSSERSAGLADVHDLSTRYRRVTENSIDVRGETVRYEAIAGETILRAGRATGGDAIGSIFSFTYLRTDRTDASRPVLFIFNGGPGSSSLWLHMGAIGPRRVELDHEVDPSNVPPFGVVDNPNSVLDVADLVFLDPVGTGFSRIVGEGTPADFFGLDADANAVAQFIELWLTEHGRWNSPKFVMGESYGSIRAAVLPRALMGGPTYTGVMRGITLDGIVLLGTTLDPRDTAGVHPPDEALDAALGLPSIAATAREHGRGSKQEMDLDALYDETTAYATTEYAEALRTLATGSLGPIGGPTSWGV